MEDMENRYQLLMARNEADLIPLTNPNFKKVIKAPWINRPLINLAWHNLVLPTMEAKLDVLHIPSARRIPVLKRTKVVATVHDLAAFSVHAKYSRARMLFNRKVVPAMIRRADHIIAVSQATADDLVRVIGYPADRISVVYSGINHALFTPGSKTQARERLHTELGLKNPFFVYVSRLEHPGKNHIRLIEAFEQFKLENDSSHQLVLVGADWPGAEAIRARAAASPVKGDILLPGFVPQDTLPLLYRGCDLMIFPSLFEGFGFPIVEALACGAPVICSNTSSMREIAGARLPTFDPASSQSISQCIESTLATGWNVAKQHDGIAYASRFNWVETARHTMEIYRSVR
jgi:glycosyltransferase involved in cell wall biosynthesis